jgi:hypothetical protein
MPVETMWMNECNMLLLIANSILVQFTRHVSQETVCNDFAVRFVPNDEPVQYTGRKSVANHRQRQDVFNAYQ